MTDIKTPEDLINRLKQVAKENNIDLLTVLFMFFKECGINPFLKQ